MKNTEGDEVRWSAWLAQAQRGDASVYEALLSELVPVIRAYLIACFGRFDILDDCVQESLLAIHQARHTYDPQRPVRPWMFAIVRHRTIDLLRRASRDERRTEPISQAVDGVVADWNLEIDGARLLNRLTATLRVALVLTKMHGLSTRECAAKLGVSESVIKVRVHRGMRQLRVLWEADSP